jgi:hypothetical protein
MSTLSVLHVIWVSLQIRLIRKFNWSIKLDELAVYKIIHFNDHYPFANEVLWIAHRRGGGLLDFTFYRYIFFPNLHKCTQNIFIHINKAKFRFKMLIWPEEVLTCFSQKYVYKMLDDSTLFGCTYIIILIFNVSRCFSFIKKWNCKNSMITFYF